MRQLTCREQEKLEAPRIIEALAEYALALWNAGDGKAAFMACEEAVHLLLSHDESDPYWKQLFLAIFEVVWYLSSMTFSGKAPDVLNYQAPRQGLFLGLSHVDTTKFIPAQKAFLRIKMAMFAEGVGKTSNAGKWAVEAFAVADEIAGARTIYPLAWLAIVPAILEHNYTEAAQLALRMADSRSPNVVELEEGGFKETDDRQRMQKFLDSTQKGTVGMRLLAMALVCRLATLQLEGTSREEISVAIESTCKSGQGDSRIESIGDALREVLLEDHEWNELRTRGQRLINTETALGLVYFVGSALKRPLIQALNMQVWLARNAGKWFNPFQSLQREIMWPFFDAYWRDILAKEPEQFRTAEKYTRIQVEAFVPSLDGVKQLHSVYVILSWSVTS